MNGGSTLSVPRSAGLDLGLVSLEHMEKVRLLIVDDEDAFRLKLLKMRGLVVSGQAVLQLVHLWVFVTAMN